MARLWRSNGIASSFRAGQRALNAATPLVVQGSVDRDGRLIEAEPRLLALQTGAGGALGDVLAVPQLASLARLARSLGVLVSRGVVVAEGDHDLDLWVRAQVDGDIVHLSVGDWNVRPVISPKPPIAAKRALEFAELEADGIWGFDEDFNLTEIDPVLSRLLSSPVSAEPPPPVTSVFRPQEAVDGAFPMLRALAMRVAFAGQIAELCGPNPARLILHAAPRYGSDGNYAGYSGGFAFEDRALWARLSVPATEPAKAPVLANGLDQALSEPLSRIVALADGIAGRSDGPLRSDYADYGRDISAAGRHLISLVTDLADVQDLETSTFQVEPEDIDLADLARKAAGLLAVKAGDASVRLDAPDADEVLTVRGDFRRVLQILVNLIGNAIRYSPEGASVWIRTEEEGDLAAIVVADQGKGLAPADHERIFEKFERVDPSEPNGSGLGLYISRRLARAMGGDITVDSAPGMGARFILTLPNA